MKVLIGNASDRYRLSVLYIW